MHSKIMEDLFIQRAQYHQSLVLSNLRLMAGYRNLSLAELESRGFIHDDSKFTQPERTAYIWMTWMYHCKHENIDFQYPASIAELVTLGWQHHIQNNAHHPEAHAHTDDMITLDIVEMVADWMAINQELQQPVASCLTWAKENIDKKWRFSANKKQFIFDTIQELSLRLSISGGKDE